MSLKQRLKNRETTYGTWLTIGHPSIAELMCQGKFDWITVDMEHSSITMADAEQVIRVIELAGIAPLVRVGHNDPNLIKRVMDAGAHGVIVPMVNTPAQAAQAVASVKYPPVGFRGVGLARAQGYGASFESYKDWNQNESIVIVQIEHIDGVNNLEAIMSTEGVDGFIIGPYDLSGSLGMPGQFDHPEVVKALDRVKKVSKEMNLLSGFHVIPPNPADLKVKKDEGYQFLAFSLDTLFLGDTLRNGMKEVHDWIID